MSLHQDDVPGAINPETPYQEPQKTCTRNKPCGLQGCLPCRTSSTHIRNLGADLDSCNTSSTPWTTDVLPQPPPNHPILLLTSAFQRAIQTKDIRQLKAYIKQYNHNLESNMEFVQFDCSKLNTLCTSAENILDSITATNTPLPSSPPNSPTSTRSNPSPYAHFKAPKISAQKWSGKNSEFYTWLHNLLNGFKLADCPDQIKLKLTLEAVPIDKQGLLNDVTEWDLFKERLIEEFGSIDVYGRDINQDFANIPRFESVQECVEILTPKIRKLQSNLKIMQQFFDVEDLHSVTLTQQLVLNIMRSLPPEVKSSFNEKYADFRDLSPANVRPPTTFTFLAQFVCKLEKNFRANPSLYDLDQTFSYVGVKPVKIGYPNTSTRPPNQPPRSPEAPIPKRPCTLCTSKGFQDDHFPLNRYCGVAKFCSKDIISLIRDLKVCPSCTQAHDQAYKCSQFFFNGASKVCPTGCTADGIPLHRKACKHSDQAPSVKVSKVSINRSVPLVEKIIVGGSNIGIQYDTGCQISLISKSALSTIPTSMYSLGTSSKVRLMTYAGEGKTILTTEIKLNLHGKILNLSIIEEDLNNGPGFSLSVPPKWKSIMGTSTSSHSGQIAILLGGDNHLFFPTEIERDSQGMALYQSNLTQSYMVYGSVPSNTITWVEPLISSFNQIRKFRRGAERIRRRIKQSGRETGGKLGTSGRKQEENQEIQEMNKGNRKRNRKKIKNFTKKSGGEPGKSGRETERKPDSPKTPDLPTSPEPPTNPNTPVELDPPTHPDPPTSAKPSTKPDTPTNPHPPIVSGNPGRNSGDKSGVGKPQEQIQNLVEDGAAENLAPETGTLILGETQDESTSDPPT